MAISIIILMIFMRGFLSCINYLKYSNFQANSGDERILQYLSWKRHSQDVLQRDYCNFDSLTFERFRIMF